jgi:ribosomal protein L16 Arg81 hydroxylase
MDALTPPEMHSGTLSELLGEHDVATFMEQYWERQPLHIRASRTNNFGNLLTLADLNRLLASCVFRADECKVAHGGNIVASSAYVSEPGERVMQRIVGDYVNAAALLNCFNQGATLVLSQLNHKWPPLQRLKEGLQRNLSANVVTNVFLSNRHSQGFALHYDSHDVFVLQLDGRKTWSLHDSPITLPTKAQAFGRTGVTAGPVTQTEILEAGDVLYVPRGVFHEAHTSDTVSLHVTLGVHPYLWIDYIGDVLQEFGSARLRWRGSVPHGAGLGAQATRDVLLRDILAELLNSEDLRPLAAATYHDAIRHRSRHGTHLFVDHLDQILRADSLSISSTLSMRDMTPPVGMTRRNGSVVVTGCGQNVTFLASCGPMIEALIAGGSFVVNDLPGDCTPDEKLAFARKLIGMGILVAC